MCQTLMPDDRETVGCYCLMGVKSCSPVAMEAGTLGRRVWVVIDLKMMKSMVEEG